MSSMNATQLNQYIKQAIGFGYTKLTIELDDKGIVSITPSSDNPTIKVR